jgi:hypothetical protein
MGSVEKQKAATKNQISTGYCVNLLINLPKDFGDYDCLCLECSNPKARELEVKMGVMRNWVMRYALRKQVFTVTDEFGVICRKCMKCVCPQMGDESKCKGDCGKLKDFCMLNWQL